MELDSSTVFKGLLINLFREGFGLKNLKTKTFPYGFVFPNERNSQIRIQYVDSIIRDWPIVFEIWIQRARVGCIMEIPANRIPRFIKYHVNAIVELSAKRVN